MEISISPIKLLIVITVIVVIFIYVKQKNSTQSYNTVVVPLEKLGDREVDEKEKTTEVPDLDNQVAMFLQRQSEALRD